MACVTPVVEHWLEREIAQWVHPMKDQSDDPSHHERTLLPWSYISLLKYSMTMLGCGVEIKQLWEITCMSIIILIKFYGFNPHSQFPAINNDY